MAGKSKWALGCGIGCALILIVLVLLGVGGYFGVKRLVEEAKEVGAVMDEMTDRYGRITEFTPDPSGAVNSERVEAFLAARELAAGERAKLETTLATLSRGEREGADSAGGTVGMVKAGLGLLPGMMRYFQGRNEALLEADMGLGEYLYLYSVVYFSWLDHSPGDGPPFVLVGSSHDSGNPWQQKADEAEVRQRRMEELRQRLGRQLKTMLRNQAEALAAGGGDPDWRRTLEAEIERMEQDRFRLPWQDGLPAQLEASLTPYRDRLESSYRPLVNPIELAAQGPS